MFDNPLTASALLDCSGLCVAAFGDSAAKGNLESVAIGWGTSITVSGSEESLSDTASSSTLVWWLDKESVALESSELATATGGGELRESSARCVSGAVMFIVDSGVTSTCDRVPFSHAGLGSCVRALALPGRLGLACPGCNSARLSRRYGRSTRHHIDASSNFVKRHGFLLQTLSARLRSQVIRPR